MGKALILHTENNMANSTDKQIRVEALIYEASRKGDLEGVVRGLMALGNDVEFRVAAGENTSFGLVQTMEEVVRRLDELPNASDLQAIHTLVFGDARLGVLGVQVLMVQMQTAVRRLDRAVRILVNVMMVLVGLGVGLGILLWLMN